MATVNYTASYTIATVLYDGTNAQEIIDLVGANHVEQPWDSATARRTLRVYGQDIAVGEYVAKQTGSNAPHPKCNAAELAAGYTIV